MKIISKIKSVLFAAFIMTVAGSTMPGCSGGESGKGNASDSTSTASTNGDDKTLLGAEEHLYIRSFLNNFQNTKN
jgi:hypothetical protein